MTTARQLGGAGRTWAVIAAAVAAAAAGPTTVPSTAPTTAPTTAPPTAPTAAPATAPVGLLAQVDAAYAALSAVQLDGTITAHFDVAGQRQDHTATFASVFAAPNRFRHEVVGDTLACSTGSRVFATLVGPSEYVTGDAPKGRVAAADWPVGVGGILAGQNPSLLLALVPSATAQLKVGKAWPAEGPAVSIDGVDCPTLRVIGDDGTVTTLAVDPVTRLVRRATVDLSAQLTKRGATDVKAATVTVDYTTVRPGVTVEAERFAYAPPAEAVLASAGPVAGGDDDGGGDTGGPAAKLVGRVAPAVKLDDLDGRPVSLADLRGKVVVLDMWATWCGPCVQSLPGLDGLAKRYRDRKADVAVYAVNLREPAAKVKSFVTRKGWTLGVLLDGDGAVAKAYGADAIPETVVVGKDGVVRKVFVGSGHEADIRAAVEAELKK